MTQVQIPPPPQELSKLGRAAFLWFTQIFTRLTSASQTLWSQIDTANSALTDLEDRSHSLLENVLSVDETDSDTTKNKHTSNALAKSSADHQAATSAHGAIGDLIGSGNTASVASAGVVLQATAVSDLGQNISDPPTETEVQAISDKIDELLASLRTAGVVDT